MGEKENSFKSEQPPTPELLATIGVLEGWVNKPTNNDTRIGAFAAGAIDALRHDSWFRELIDYSLEMRSNIQQQTLEGFDPRLFANLLLRTAQHILLHDQNTIDYPQKFDNPKTWSEALSVIAHDHNMENHLLSDLIFELVHSNIPGRYAGEKIALLPYLSRFKRINSLDVGSSLGLGVEKLLRNDPFQHIDVLSYYKDYTLLLKRPDLTNALNQKLNNLPLNFGRCASLDIMADRHELVKERVRSHSFYPSELLTSYRVDEFDRLAESVSKKHDYYVGNFAYEETIANILSESPVKKFQLITFFTVLHQVHPEDREIMLDHARKLLAPGGLIIIQDFARLNHNYPINLEFFRKWGPQTYRTYIIDSAVDLFEPSLALLWRDARCTQVTATAEFGKLLVPELITS